MSGNAGNYVNELSLPELYSELSATGLITRLLELARDEDLGIGGNPGDLTCLVTLEESQELEARLSSREDFVAAGLAILPEAIKIFAPDVRMEQKVTDGTSVPKGTVLATLKGPSHQLLRLERTVLNTVSRLSGIATRTRKFVDAIAAALEPGAARTPQLLDTRKTTPGLRMLEKYAVRCGGGFCHRIGLYDAVLIKDNHLAGLEPAQVGERVSAAVARAAKLREQGVAIKFIEVEVDTLDQLAELLKLPEGAIDFVLLDNMEPARLLQAVKMRNDSGSRIRLEASGGVNLDTISAIARAGVDRISVGGLTHQAAAVDIGLDA